MDSSGVRPQITSANLVLLACAVLAHVSGAAANKQQDPVPASCPVQYTAKQLNGQGLDEPLLLGGVWSGCTGNCQPRDDSLSQICLADPDALAIINVCEYWQRPAILEVANRVSNGAISKFSPCDFWQYVKGRTLWLVGDSHTKNMYNALRCFMIDFFNHSDGECAASSNHDLQSLLEQTALRGHIYNTPPRCIHLLGGGRVCMVHNPMGTTMVSTDEHVLGTLQLLHIAFAQPDDIILTSFGRWHSNNCGGVDKAYTDALELVGSYLQKQRSAFPNTFFQAADHDHTVCTNGTLNDTLPLCPPVTEGGYDLGISAKLHSLAHSIMKEKYGIPVIDSHEASLFLHDGHVMGRQTIAGRTDCLHYCRPGMPEIDIWYMTHSFATAGIKQLTHPPNPSSPPRQCIRVLPQNFKPFGATNGTNSVNASTPAGDITAPIDNTTAPIADNGAAPAPGADHSAVVAPAPGGWSFVTSPAAGDGTAPAVVDSNSTDSTAGNSTDATGLVDSTGTAENPTEDADVIYTPAPAAGGAATRTAGNSTVVRVPTVPIDQHKDLDKALVETFLADLFAGLQQSGSVSHSSTTSSTSHEGQAANDLLGNSSAMAQQVAKPGNSYNASASDTASSKGSAANLAAPQLPNKAVVPASPPAAARAPRNSTRRPIEILFIPNADTAPNTSTVPHDQLAFSLPDTMQSTVGRVQSSTGSVSPRSSSALTPGTSEAKGSTSGNEVVAQVGTVSQSSSASSSLILAPGQAGLWVGEQGLDQGVGHLPMINPKGLTAAYTRQPVVSTEHVTVYKEGVAKAQKWDPNDGNDLYQIEDSLAAVLEPSKLHTLWPSKDLTYTGPLVPQKKPNRNKNNKQTAVVAVNKRPKRDPWVDTEAETDPDGLQLGLPLHSVGTAANSDSTIRSEQQQHEMDDSGNLGARETGVMTNSRTQGGFVYLVSTGGVPLGSRRAESASFIAPDMPLGEDGSYLFHGP